MLTCYGVNSIPIVTRYGLFKLALLFSFAYCMFYYVSMTIAISFSNAVSFQTTVCNRIKPFGSKQNYHSLQLTLKFAGIPSYILINATGLESPGRFRSLRLLDIAGRTIRVFIRPLL